VAATAAEMPSTAAIRAHGGQPAPATVRSSASARWTAGLDGDGLGVAVGVAVGVGVGGTVSTAV
jgi:hypothetical protein